MNKIFSLPSLSNQKSPSPTSKEYQTLTVKTLTTASTNFNTTQKNFNPRSLSLVGSSPDLRRNQPTQLLGGVAPQGTSGRSLSQAELKTNNFMQGYHSLQERKNFTSPLLPGRAALEQERQELESRETMFRFYAKDTDKLKSRLKTPGYIGENSILQFYKKYKNLEKVQELGKDGYSASTAFMTQAHQLKVIPSPMIGLIQHKGDNTAIRATNMKLGNDYAQVLSKSMKFLQNTETVDLPGNRLGKQGGIAILTSLVEKVRVINLDNNKIGEEGLNHLVNWIEQSQMRCNLEELSLENNNFGDSLCTNLVEALFKSSAPIINLNLSHNNIGDKGATHIADLVNMHPHLRVLKIAWNKIQTRGGVAIAEALKDNKKIYVFDGSFNQFGQKRNGIFGLKMAEALNQGQLLHVDLSYNSMDANECQIFGEAIKDNHTVWGLHMMGNDCMIDSFGFIRPKMKTKVATRDILHQGIGNGAGFLSNVVKSKDAKILSYQNCWICEGWREQKFEIKVGKSIKFLKDPVYIHFDFDEYKPWLLQKQEADDEITYYLWRMVPPGKSYYFYSSGGEPEGTAQTAHDQLSMKLPMVKHVKHIHFKEFDEEKGKQVEYELNFQINRLNYIIGPQKRVLDDYHSPLHFEVMKPRINDLMYTRVYNERPRTPWTFPISIFKDYQMDNEAKIAECFEFDWSNMKFPKMSDDEMAQVKEELRKSYPVIRETFKFQSAVACNTIWSISLNGYTDFVKQINLVDGNIIKFAQSDTEFITMNKRTKASPLNPGNSIVRFQFLEILMRLAFKRYEETKEATNKPEAIRMMYEKNLFPFYGTLNTQKWRDERYWNEEVDNIYKAHFPLFDYLYKNFGCHYLKPGDKPFMMVDEFEKLFAQAGLINDNFVQRDIYVSFNNAMMTQVNELDKDRHLKAVFIEFLEAFGRACDIMSLPPLDEDEEGGQEFKLLSDEERKSQPLYKKIENALPIVYQNCFPNSFKEKWKWPKKDPKYGLYIDKYFNRKSIAKRQSSMMPALLNGLGLGALMESPDKNLLSV